MASILKKAQVATYKNIPFFIENEEIRRGNNTFVYTQAGSNTVSYTPLGSKEKRFYLTFYILEMPEGVINSSNELRSPYSKYIGNVMKHYEDLIEALESPVEGTLTLPSLGSFNVITAGQMVVSHSRKSFNRINFRVSFSEVLPKTDTILKSLPYVGKFLDITQKALAGADNVFALAEATNDVLFVNTVGEAKELISHTRLLLARTSGFKSKDSLLLKNLQSFHKWQRSSNSDINGIVSGDTSMSKEVFIDETRDFIYNELSQKSLLFPEYIGDEKGIPLILSKEALQSVALQFLDLMLLPMKIKWAIYFLVRYFDTIDDRDIALRVVKTRFSADFHPELESIASNAKILYNKKRIVVTKKTSFHRLSYMINGTIDSTHFLRKHNAEILSTDVEKGTFITVGKNVKS